jgi:hypothetical protein
LPHVELRRVQELTLVSFSLAFAAEFSSRGRLFANMRFAAEGRGRELSKSSPDRAAWLNKNNFIFDFWI